VRKHGLTVDSLLAADVVTADGVLRRVDAGHEPDLFWAIRGGGTARWSVSYGCVDHEVTDVGIVPIRP
jgi:FAD/FMN-containing dehydrogenase